MKECLSRATLGAVNLAVCLTLAERREKRKRWVQRGEYAIEVEVEVVYPAEVHSEACLEPETVRWLDEVARKAEEGDLEFLRRAGRVFQSVTS